MTVSYEKFVAPLQELGALNVANIEKLVSLQLEGIEEIANAGVDALKKATAVKDVEGAKSYYTGQTEVARSIIENAVARSKSAVEIAQVYPTSVKRIVDNALAIG